MVVCEICREFQMTHFVCGGSFRAQCVPNTAAIWMWNTSTKSTCDVYLRTWHGENGEKSPREGNDAHSQFHVTKYGTVHINRFVFSLGIDAMCLCVGAFIFLSIESEQNSFAERLNGTMIAYRANLTAQLWEITMTINNFERDKYLNQ